MSSDAGESVSPGKEQKSRRQLTDNSLQAERVAHPKSLVVTLPYGSPIPFINPWNLIQHVVTGFLLWTLLILLVLVISTENFRQDSQGSGTRHRDL